MKQFSKQLKKYLKSTEGGVNREEGQNLEKSRFTNKYPVARTAVVGNPKEVLYALIEPGSSGAANNTIVDRVLLTTLRKSIQSDIKL